MLEVLLRDIGSSPKLEEVRKTARYFMMMMMVVMMIKMMAITMIIYISYDEVYVCDVFVYSELSAEQDTS